MKKSFAKLWAGADAMERLARAGVRAAVAQMHAQGVATHHLEDGRIVETRPDGTRHEVERPQQNASSRKKIHAA